MCTKPKNHTELYLLLTFAQQNTVPCVHKNKLCAWAANNFPPLDMAFLPTVL